MIRGNRVELVKRRGVELGRSVGFDNGLSEVGFEERAIIRPES